MLDPTILFPLPLFPEELSVVVVTQTHCEGRVPNHRGKVRDIYDKGQNLLIVTTDRISAYDVVMPQGIPYKGMVLHSLTKWWMTTLGVPTHYVTDDLDDIGEPFKSYPEMFRGRTMLVKKYDPVPIEAIVRGYLCGSAWKEYNKTRGVCGVRLPENMQQNQAFFQPIFTPSTKAEADQHDENITCQEMETILAAWLAKQAPKGCGPEEVGHLANRLAGMLHTQSVSLFNKAAGLLWNKGLIMADTKLEWGLTPGWLGNHDTTRLTLIDECFTPDSSRFWDFRNYTLGGNVKSLDKQTLRDWLDAHKDWNRQAPAPNLTPDLIEILSKTYLAIHERITGSKLEVEA